jgi:hypothetical protein
MAQKRVNILVSDDCLDRFAEVVKACQKTGLKIEQQTGATGVISGTIDPAKITDLKKVKGISEVEQSRDIQLPPPGSPVQ